MVRRNIHARCNIRMRDLAFATRANYMSRMSLRLETRPHASAHRHDACCAGHAVPAEQTLAAAEQTCRARGLRLTAQRRAVLERLAVSQRPLGAYDLIELLRAETGRAPAPIAIYRALDFLRENGFIHRLETLNAFIACPHGHGASARVVFLICETCRHVEEAVAEKLDKTLGEIAAAQGFTPRRQVVELAGSCRACAAESRS
ncbi:MAG: transcriptional repressor [Hyphomicrobiales bacterium]|uniref:transcriptional repressor n=1 Tax=Rhabdaerophilum calidifontis TaxID=2604328 RepID=UPI001FEC3884|nr:transcriptional repressor [Rhabdaerophilum calidifontis]MCA1951821.1 transcriptional repressor [Hyphomicrobiales bacterium]MCA1998831.1 transcriptional repressor [Hyphomicrobiales bacterium]